MKEVYANKFAENVFDDGKMQKYLPKETYEAIIEAKKNGVELSQHNLNVFASALKKWAEEKGVTRYTHWFQPLNGYTAEKRDCFYSIDNLGLASEKFRGKELVEGEGDASSLPSGGLRQTFEARGISQIDLSTNAFIKDDCLCIPTTFRSYTGSSLDKKTPLLRSEKALNKQAVRIMKLLGFACEQIKSVVGAEQEYFLIDKELFVQRSDLIYTGRTLFGARPPKGQEFCDHYFRSIPTKVAEFMKEVDDELWKLGIVVKTEHNEVAPGQFELAPCYSQTSAQSEQNLLIMETLKSVADKRNLACILSEKPFDGYNGSGKHNNWSLVTDTGENLLEMGKTFQQKARFLLFISAVIQACDNYSDALVASVNTRPNDLRLGGHEAPPQILSIYLGGLQNATNDFANNLENMTPVSADRNRTSPFAFTGNKFEFRMVGSSANISDVNTALNTAVAESLREYADRLDCASDVWQEVKNIVCETFKNHDRIIFDGNNYSEDWQKEAKKRKLKSLTTVEAYESLSNDKNLQLFATHGVLSSAELFARQYILFETYCNTVMLECNCALEIAERQILPAVEKYVATLTQTALCKRKLEISYSLECDKIRKLSILQKECEKNISILREQIAHKEDDIKTQAEYLCKTVLSTERALRLSADKMESMCPKEFWCMPSYGDMLF